MRFFIGCLIRGEAKDYQEKLIEGICEKFDMRNLNDYVPAHFTLKSPFETGDISEVEAEIEKFCLGRESCDILIDEIGSFGNNIVFLDGKFCTESEKIFRELILMLRKFDWIKFRDYEFDKVHFHSTVTRTKNEPQFFEIMDFLKDETPEFKVTFDNLTIFKNVNQRWEIHKEFRFE